MSRPLPLRASLEWLRKLCKDRLKARRVEDPSATLASVQLEVAREYGFPSWRKLKAHVEATREKLDAVVPPEQLRQAAGEVVADDDPELGRLFALIAAGDTQAVVALIGRRPALARAQASDGKTPLHAAVECNDPTLAAALAAYGADLEASFGPSGNSPLSWALTCNAPECARTLVRLGAELDLFCAAGLGDVEGMRARFDSTGNPIPRASKTGSSRFDADGTRLPCPPDSPREQVFDALAFACRTARVEAVRFLLGKSPDLDFRAFMGARPLHWAHFGGSREIVAMLEQAGANPTLRDGVLGCTPRAFGVCAPASWGLAFLVRARLDAEPSLVNLTDGRTSPLHEAVRGGSAEVVRLLLGRGADSTLRDARGRTPLDLAVELGRAELAETLRSAKRPDA